MNTFLNLIANKNNYKHHALLLLSNFFAKNTIPENLFISFVKEFCEVDIQSYEIASQHPDIFIADRERKILRIEEIKSIRDFSLYPPQFAKKRLFFIENCERLNANAANALLKVLEEPATNCLFVLTSRLASLVMPTILSRLQKISLSFEESNQIDFKSHFSFEDMNWVTQKISRFDIRQINSKPNKASLIADTIQVCDKLAKEYQAEDLRALIVTLINERLKREPAFINFAKFVLKTIAEWKEFESYHPSTALWLYKIFF